MPPATFLIVSTINTVGIDLATIGPLLVGVGAVLGAGAAYIARKDDRKVSELELAWSIQKDTFATQGKDLDDAKDTIRTLEQQLRDQDRDFRAELRTRDDRILEGEKRYTELERRHHECEKGRHDLTAEIQWLKRFIPNLPPTQGPDDGQSLR